MMIMIELEMPLTLKQAQEKSLKQQVRRLQIQQKQQRLHKQRNSAAITAQQIVNLQNKSV